MSAAQSGRPGGFKIPGGAVAYRGYRVVRFGSPDERSAIREGQVASKSPVALSLTGATALCDLVARMSAAQSGDLLV